MRHHRRQQGRHGVRLVLPRHRLRDDDRLPLAADADEERCTTSTRTCASTSSSGMRKRGMTDPRGRRTRSRSTATDGRVRSVTVRLADRRGGRPRDRLRVPRHRRAARRRSRRRRCSASRSATTGRVVVNKRMQTSVPGRLRDRRHDRRADGDVQGPQVRASPPRATSWARTSSSTTPSTRTSCTPPTRSPGSGSPRPRRARRYDDVIIIQMPPYGRGPRHRATCRCRAPRARCSTRSASPSSPGFQKLVIDGDVPQGARRPPRRLRRQGRVPVPRLPDPPPRRADHRHSWAG